MASSTIAAAFFGSAPYSSWSAVTLPAPKQRLSRPLDRWSRNASRPATWAGWCWLRQTGAGPRRMRLRLAQGAGDEDLGHHDVLVLHRVMLADPELAEAQLLGPDDQLQVLVVALRQRLGRVVERHDEHAVADRPRAPRSGSWFVTPLRRI